MKSCIAKLLVLEDRCVTADVSDHRVISQDDCRAWCDDIVKFGCEIRVETEARCDFVGIDVSARNGR
jgi:hypothetical protein